MWRAYIAQNKHRVVLDGIDANDQSVLQSIRKVAEYFAYADKRNEIMEYFDGKLNEDFEDDNRQMWCISAATIYYNEGIYENALRVLNGQTDLECLAMSIQCLLKMNRLDLAKKVLVRMQEKDDDATLTQLATAWINISTGGEKLQDAYFIYQDFCDKFVTTSLLLNGQAVCHVGQEKFEEAESALRESLDKDSNNYNTLINMIALSQHTEKNSDVSDVVLGDWSIMRNNDTMFFSLSCFVQILNRYLSQIKDSHKTSALVVELEKKESEFDRLCQKYEPSVTTVPEISG